MAGFLETIHLLMIFKLKQIHDSVQELLLGFLGAVLSFI